MSHDEWQRRAIQSRRGGVIDLIALQAQLIGSSSESGAVEVSLASHRAGHIDPSRLLL